MKTIVGNVVLYRPTGKQKEYMSPDSEGLVPAIIVGKIDESVNLWVFPNSSVSGMMLKNIKNGTQPGEWVAKNATRKAATTKSKN